jgi:hypothetical protein
METPNQLLVGVMTRVDFMKEFLMFGAVASASGG